VIAGTTLADGHLSIVVFGPGYGESVAVRGPDGRWLVVDSLREPGSERNPALELLRIFEAAPELLVLTHDHEDHANGFADLIQRQLPATSRVGCVPANMPPSEDPLTHPDAGAALRRGRVRLALSAIQARWDTEPGSRWLLKADEQAPLGSVDIHLLSPRDALIGKARVARNQLSAAVLLIWGEVKVVLGADLPSAEWNRVDESIELSDHRLFKVAHHGSRRSQHRRLTPAAGSGAVWILAPWTKAGRHLPRLADNEDLDLLLREVDRVEMTSSPDAELGSACPSCACRAIAPRRSLHLWRR
jgi:beta-lactamase superfamily II metal-dependent hydrolase